MLKIPPATERQPPRLVPALATAVLVALLAAAFSFEGCATMAIRPDSAHYRKPVVVKMTVTGYCNCRKCCGWRYTWYGKPVYDKSGKTKKVGMTASGVRARTGTIAADIKKYPYGTIVEIPGYGYGRVEDIGGAIKGEHLDAWFPHHAEALKWGKQTLNVKVWLPK